MTASYVSRRLWSSLRKTASLSAGGWARGFLLGLVVAACGRSDYAVPCEADADCGDGSVCTPEGLCVELEGECIVDAECESGEKCLDYMCVAQQICDDDLGTSGA